MLELYMRLFEARSVNFEARGNGAGIGRDEILGAAAAATQQHPLGNRMVLAEMGDQYSLSVLDGWAAAGASHALGLRPTDMSAIA